MEEKERVSSYEYKYWQLEIPGKRCYEVNDQNQSTKMKVGLRKFCIVTELRANVSCPLTLFTKLSLLSSLGRRGN